MTNQPSTPNTKQHPQHANSDNPGQGWFKNVEQQETGSNTFGMPGQRRAQHPSFGHQTTLHRPLVLHNTTSPGQTTRPGVTNPTSNQIRPLWVVWWFVLATVVLVVVILGFS